MFNSAKTALVSSEQALPGRHNYTFSLGDHRIYGEAMTQLQHFPCQVLLGMGCFWGAERLFWQQKGVLFTAAGYAGGYTPYPLYDEVCSGLTGHAEVVAVAYDPEQISFRRLLDIFWEQHDPTQGMRQGNDHGTQYRSAIYCFNASQLKEAEQSRAQYQQRLNRQGFSDITTEIRQISAFYFAEPFHQQYLDANPGGYCGLKGTGVTCSS